MRKLKPILSTLTLLAILLVTAHATEGGEVPLPEEDTFVYTDEVPEPPLEDVPLEEVHQEEVPLAPTEAPEYHYDEDGNIIGDVLVYEPNTTPQSQSYTEGDEIPSGSGVLKIKADTTINVPQAFNANSFFGYLSGPYPDDFIASLNAMNINTKFNHIHGADCNCADLDFYLETSDPIHTYQINLEFLSHYSKTMVLPEGYYKIDYFEALNDPYYECVLATPSGYFEIKDGEIFDTTVYFLNESIGGEDLLGDGTGTGFLTLYYQPYQKDEVVIVTLSRNGEEYAFPLHFDNNYYWQGDMEAGVYIVEEITHSLDWNLHIGGSRVNVIAGQSPEIRVTLGSEAGLSDFKEVDEGLESYENLTSESTETEQYNMISVLQRFVVVALVLAGIVGSLCVVIIMRDRDRRIALNNNTFDDDEEDWDD